MPAFKGTLGRLVARLERLGAIEGHGAGILAANDFTAAAPGPPRIGGVTGPVSAAPASRAFHQTHPRTLGLMDSQSAEMALDTSDRMR